MSTLIRIAISLLMLQIVAVQSDSVITATVFEPDKRTQRSSKSAVKNKAKQVRELIHAAANGNNEKVIEVLNKGINVNATFERDNSELSGMTALMVASSRGYPNLVEELIKRRANVNLKRYGGHTALLLAAGSGNAKIVRLLLKAGANPNVKVASFHAGEITPLILAMKADKHERLEMAESLIAAGARINPRGPFMASPLTHALDDLEMVKLLIAHGANVNERNFRGVTPLMVAAGAGSPSVLRFLLEVGADVNARDEEGATAVVYANHRNGFDTLDREEVIELLRRAQANPR